MKFCRYTFCEYTGDKEIVQVFLAIVKGTNERLISLNLNGSNIFLNSKTLLMVKS